MGDDIGYWNISAYNRGMMGYRTPNIDRIANEGAIFTDYYAPAVLHRRPRRLHHRPEPDPHRPAQGRPAAAKEGLSDKDPTLAELLKPHGYADRAVRQEPPRRPQRIPADRARLRRVLRQPLSPQRRGGAGEPGLSEGTRAFESQEVRPARRAQMQGDRDRDDADGGPALRPGRQADDRGHRPAHQEAHGDGGRGVPRRVARFHRPRQQGQASRSSSGSTRRACTSGPI